MAGAYAYGLDDIKAQMVSAEVLSGSFTQQKQVSGFRKPLVSKGSYVLWSGHGVLWKTYSPFASTLLMTRNVMVAKNGDGQDAYQLKTQSEPALQMVNMLIMSLLSGDIDFLDARFFSEVKRTDAAKGNDSSWRLKLKPKDKAMQRLFNEINLGGDRFVREVELMDKNSDVTRIVFNDFNVNPVLSVADRSQLER